MRLSLLITLHLCYVVDNKIQSFTYYKQRIPIKLVVCCTIFTKCRIKSVNRCLLQAFLVMTSAHIGLVANDSL